MFRKNKKGQSFIEFLIAIFLFLGIIAALLLSSSIRIKGEVEKIAEQDAILQANLMAAVAMGETGPALWESGATLPQRCGLNDGNAHILLNKIRKFKLFNFEDYAGCLGINTSWQLSYQVVGIPFKSSAVADVNCPLASSSNILQICNSNAQLNISANTSMVGPVKYEIEMFFPNIEGISNLQNQSYAGSAINITNTSNIYSGEAGTYVRGTAVSVTFNLTGNTGLQWFTIISNGLPIKGFIKRISTPPSIEVNVTIDHYEAVDFIGARLGTAKKNFAEAQRFVLLNTTSELAPAIVRVSTWH